MAMAVAMAIRFMVWLLFRRGRRRQLRESTEEEDSVVIFGMNLVAEVAVRCLCTTSVASDGSAAMEGDEGWYTGKYYYYCSRQPQSSIRTECDLANGGDLAWPSMDEFID